jgi:DNA repair protein RadC
MNDKPRKIASEASPTYLTAVDNKPTDQAVIIKALSIIESRLTKSGELLTNTESVSDYLKIKLAELDHETFNCLFLDNKHRLISFETLFTGTIDGCSVHPREVVKKALACNAAAIIFAHNHPSGEPEPSELDKNITKHLKDALALFDIRTLDHIIIGGMNTVSFAARGLI